MGNARSKGRKSSQAYMDIMTTWGAGRTKVEQRVGQARLTTVYLDGAIRVKTGRGYSMMHLFPTYCFRHSRRRRQSGINFHGKLHLAFVSTSVCTLGLALAGVPASSGDRVEWGRRAKNLTSTVVTQYLHTSQTRQRTRGLFLLFAHSTGLPSSETPQTVSWCRMK